MINYLGLVLLNKIYNVVKNLKREMIYTHLILLIATFSSVCDGFFSKPTKTWDMEDARKSCEDNAAKSDAWLLEHTTLTRLYMVSAL